MAIQISGGVQLSGPVLLDPTGGSPSPTPSGGFQGSNYGYTSGGFNPTTSPNHGNVIDKYSFTSDGSAADVGDLTSNLRFLSGNSSSTDGYAVGGQGSSNIQKFSFSSDGNASNVGTQSFERYGTAGQSSSTDGYTTGGFNPGALNIIDKFPFASNGTATDVGDLVVSRAYVTGVSSSTVGYSAGGNGWPGSNPLSRDTIDKFPFASDSNATDVGDLTLASAQNKAGQNNSTHGFVSGGWDGNLASGPTAGVTTIEQFSFSTDGNTTDVSDLATGAREVTGTSSTTSGYNVGGVTQANAITNSIQKYSFSTLATASGIGSLTQGRSGSSGQQY